MLGGAGGEVLGGAPPEVLDRARQEVLRCAQGEMWFRYQKGIFTLSDCIVWVKTSTGTFSDVLYG